MTAQVIDRYFWAEFWHEEPHLDLRDVITELSPFVTGLTAVNVSWDSGKLTLSEEQLSVGWQSIQGYAVTPPLDQALTDNWPSSECGFDEWYFFKALPPKLDLQAFCNWLHVSVGDFESIAFAFDLREQLQRYEPELVIGEGYGIFMLAKDARAVEQFRSLATEKGSARLPHKTQDSD